MNTTATKSIKIHGKVLRPGRHVSFIDGENKARFGTVLKQLTPLNATISDPMFDVVDEITADQLDDAHSKLVRMYVVRASQITSILS